MKPILFAALALSLSSPAFAASVLFEDDFENNTAGANRTPSGWSAVSGAVDITGPGYFPQICYNTGNCIDLDGSSGTVGHIQTTQSFTLTTGALYSLTFDYTWNYFQQQNPNSMNFGVGGFSDSLTTTGTRTSDGTGAYESLSFSFLGNGSTGAIFFQHLGASDLGGIVIDNVTLTETPVTAPVPLPAGLPLLLAGLGGLALARRKS
ncbi:VPLPA-CTERM sorting domain-containing protein [Primorskyibacter sp. S187A]|uniref:VPLPA-CTERM sorting domain-containing protein n=1 Tax=Primorskyibacter sp. S187A TaxID=3415130 RepID=UPI003C7C32E1